MGFFFSPPFVSLLDPSRVIALFKKPDAFDCGSSGWNCYRKAVETPPPPSNLSGPFTPESIMELVIICSTYLSRKNLCHVTLRAIPPQLTRKRPITFTCSQTHECLPFSSSTRVILMPFNMHCAEKKVGPHLPPPLQLPSLSDALTVRGWKPIRLLGSTHERIPVKAPTEEKWALPLNLPPESKGRPVDAFGTN